MNDLNKKELSETLKEHIDRESLHSREVARILNLIPAYISMARNEKSWEHLPKHAWERIADWFYTRGPLSEYKRPEGEAVLDIFLKEKDPSFTNLSRKEKEIVEEVKEKTEKIAKAFKVKKQKQGKSVKLMINSALMTTLENRIKRLEDQNLLLVNDNNQLSQELGNLKNKLFVLEDEMLPVLNSRIEDATRMAKEAQEGVSHLVTIPKQIDKPSVVVFQRNIYKS